ncbi:hypothetical protein NLX83_29220 [Allokutzneria sp. A3M-2-11 16]|uniref:hypothetical protein n=1 Tax=Allokutzneria sp. A3M-2-11 16 TaxID=2962043 RepID=UPI0020B7F10E|nr:hypothetical protein [Allokutzneria sp. A3M-2-11 16]MCP3803362.1 hypothetical protein [Allokutzneria sp. A3M-2-11 16]
MTTTPVAAIEFTGIAAHRQLAGVLPEGAALTRLDPLAHYFDGNPGLAELARTLAGAIDPATATIVANCSGASLALAVAAEHGPVEVLLVSPERITDDTVRAEFDASYRSLGGDPAGVTGPLDGLTRALEELREPLAESMGGEPALEAVTYLLSRHRAWLRYLTQTARTAPVSTASPVRVLTELPELDLSWLLAEPGQARVRHFDTDRDGMFTDERVRAAVAALLPAG